MPQVLEETGYDIEELVKEEDFIELTLDGKRNKLYIVAGLDPNSAQFAPKCKGVSGAALLRECYQCALCCQQVVYRQQTAAWQSLHAVFCNPDVSMLCVLQLVLCC